MSQKSSASLSSASTDSITLEYANTIPADIPANTIAFNNAQTNESGSVRPVILDCQRDRCDRLHYSLWKILRITATRARSSSPRHLATPFLVPDKVFTVPHRYQSESLGTTWNPIGFRALIFVMKCKESLEVMTICFTWNPLRILAECRNIR